MEAVGEDPSWAKFDAFHAYLRNSFPLVYVTLSMMFGRLPDVP
jgi:hypothetical protein